MPWVDSAEKDPSAFSDFVKKSSHTFVFLVTFFFGVIFCNLATAADFSSQQIQKVFTVILENSDFEDAIRQPFLKKLAQEGTLFTNYYGVARPSYPNYLALTSGNRWHVRSDRQRTLDVPHIGDLLEKAGKTWKTYAEDYPGGLGASGNGKCFLESKQGQYVRKHVPFLSYKNIQENEKRCTEKIVNANELENDVEAGVLAHYSMYIPNNDNNGHDTSVRFADRHLEKRFSALLKNPRFTDQLLFIVTFDEADYWGRNHIYTAFWGPMIQAGKKIRHEHDHYDLLRTIEDLWNLGSLGQYDAKARAITFQ